MDRNTMLWGAPAAAADRSSAIRALGASTALVILFTVLTVLAGLVRVPLPFTPVPLTLQLVPVLLAGAALGPGRAVASQILLVVAGLAGLPVFAAGGFGPAHLLGPSGGYLLGFVGGAWLTGKILNGPVRLGYAGTLLAMVAGAVLVHFFGVVHLTVYTGGSLLLAFELGSLPFLIGDLLKAILAASIVAAWPWRRCEP